MKDLTLFRWMAVLFVVAGYVAIALGDTDNAMLFAVLGGLSFLGVVLIRVGGGR